MLVKRWAKAWSPLKQFLDLVEVVQAFIQAFWGTLCTNGSFTRHTNFLFLRSSRQAVQQLFRHHDLNLEPGFSYSSSFILRKPSSQRLGLPYHPEGITVVANYYFPWSFKECWVLMVKWKHYRDVFRHTYVHKPKHDQVSSTQLVRSARRHCISHIVVGI